MHGSYALPRVRDHHECGPAPHVQAVRRTPRSLAEGSTMKRVVVLGLALAALIGAPVGARAAPSGMEFIPLHSVNTGLGQCNVVAVSGNLIAIHVDEGYQKQDLDGDHLTTHTVLFVYDIAKQKATGTIGTYATNSTGRW